MEREKEIDAIRESVLIEVSKENFDKIMRVSKNVGVSVDEFLEHIMRGFI